MSDASLGQFVWYDLRTSDPDQAITFYTHVIGWTSLPSPTGYTTWVSGDRPVGGVASLPSQAHVLDTPPHWTANVHVADVDATVAEVRRLDGRVYVEPTEHPKVGRMAAIGDQQGARLNVIQPNQPLRLPDSNQPGEFIWHELLTTDHEAAFAFHAKLFGWQRLRDFDMGSLGTYLIYGLSGRELGGMFTKAKDMTMPPVWFYYVEIADLDQTLARATAKGGRVLNGPMEIPGGRRIVQLADPQGAAFALHEAPKRG